MIQPAKWILLAVVPLACSVAVRAAENSTPPRALDVSAAGRFAALALACLHKEYPNKIAHVMAGDADARPPRELTPAFYGCYDWHSNVHGHWLLVRLARLFPNAPFAAQARTELARSFSAANIAGEVAYLRGDGRSSFERPYGLAWLLQLAAELRQWDDPQARQWAATLAPLETEAASHIRTWLPKLQYPIRIGEHDQTAFSFGLIWDWAGVAGDAPMRKLLEDAAQRFYLKDRNCPLSYEPSGQDFLSPCLAEADFIRRVLPAPEFARWLSGFLPGIPTKAQERWLGPGIVTDRSDPKLAHIDGLNLSRAWMLEGIAHGLGPRDARVPALLAAAAQHRESALPAVTGEHYEGGHWLGTFAVYLTTQAGTSSGALNRRAARNGAPLSRPPIEGLGRTCARPARPQEEASCTTLYERAGSRNVMREAGRGVSSGRGITNQFKEPCDHQTRAIDALELSRDFARSREPGTVFAGQRATTRESIRARAASRLTAPLVNAARHSTSRS